MVCPLAKTGRLGTRADLPGPQACSREPRRGHRRLQNGASNKQAVGRDVVGEDWLQQRPGGTAP
jgi:hypothetical protein